MELNILSIFKIWVRKKTSFKYTGYNFGDLGDKDFMDSIFYEFNKLEKENKRKIYPKSTPMDDWPGELLDRVFNKD